MKPLQGSFVGRSPWTAADAQEAGRVRPKAGRPGGRPQARAPAPPSLETSSQVHTQPGPFETEVLCLS